MVFPKNKRQGLIKIKKEETAFSDYEWDEWDEDEMEDVLNDTLTRKGT